ncbi:MAG: putative surface protein bspA-like [Candidatus Malacoplasma girerdii]|nr:MAG: putative surface protein bspA-like [Candidatus Malacoplasma girerdii]
MKIKNFNKFLIGLAIVSSGLAGTILYNSNIHSSLVVENKATNDISWGIDGNGNIWPTDRSKVSGEITIPNTVDGKVVTGIANYAFIFCNKLISITISNNVTSIGIGAFGNCSSLKTFNIPGSVTSIANYAFQGCSSLISINIPSSVTSIGIQAFQNCSALTSVNFAEGSKLNSIGKYAFSECASLTSVNIPNSVTSIAMQAFNGCSSLKDVTFNWNEEQLNKLILGTDLFNNTSSSQTINFHIPLGTKVQYTGTFTRYILGFNITANWISYIQWSITNDGLISPADKRQIQGEITIPDTVSGKVVTGIANAAFKDCALLTSVTFAEGSKLTSIGDRAFDSCSALTSINIPSGVTSIGGWAFSGCFKLISITFAEGSKLTSIGKNAFWVCSALTSITIPSGVTSIGKEAFSYCPLTSIEFAGNQTYDWVPTVEGGITVGGYIIQKGNDLSTNTVVGCLAYGKINIKLPDGKTSIIGNAFSCCSGITHIGISDNVTNIGGTAFWNCTSLTSIIIPSSITSIGETAFGNCDKMGTITFNWNEEQLIKLTLGNNLIRNDTSSQTINFHIPWGTKDQYKAKFTKDILGTNVTANWIDDIQWSITDDGFISPANKDLIKGDVTIPNTVGGKVVTGIANSAFNGCGSLKSVNFAEGSKLNSIGENAFESCTSLTSINIPSSVTSIGEKAFRDCTSLISITVPSSVTSIGDYAFVSCPLTNIKFTDNDTYKRVSTKSKDGKEIGVYIINKNGDLSNNTVTGCLAYGKIDIKLPDGKTNISDYAFSGCSALTSINIPNNVTSIGYRAFSGCSSLTSVTFAEGSQLTSIGSYAFNLCSSLTSIDIPNSVNTIRDQAFDQCNSLTDVYFNWNKLQLGNLSLGNYLFRSVSSSVAQTINFHIPLGTKDQYNAKFTQKILGTNITANWIEDNPPVPSSNSNLGLILGLTFGFIILIGIGSYLGYRYYKHRKAINKK